ncbi:FecR family protein [Accumulibacter sp.]|uniref:FecR family protein n=1 Tax=Accumulibacter sp. TaxID=2053492 RepID=UPI0028C50A63|nr:FecR family protein [Accumulibacter sp.]
MAASRQSSTTSDGPALVHWLRLASALLFCLAVGGCAGITLNVVQNGQLVDSGTIAGVDVIRKGVRSQAKHNMPLEAGDEVQTNAQSTVVLSFADGARVYVQPNTHVRLGSIFVFIGEVLVKVKGYFAVQTEYATAGSEGTEYLVRVDPEQRVRVVVAEDRVGVTSNSGRWTRTSIGAGQAAWLAGPNLVEVGQVSYAEVEDIRKRIRELDALAPNRSNLGTAALIGGIFAIGVGAATMGSPGDDDVGRQPPARAPRREQ